MLTGPFVEQTGRAWVRVIIRDSKGEVVLSAWRVLFRCASAVKAEALAYAEGIRLTS